MNRAKTLAAIVGGWVVLAGGSGCAMLDPWDDGDTPRTESRREGPPPPRTAGVQQPAEVTNAANPAVPANPTRAAGVYAEGDRR